MHQRDLPPPLPDDHADDVRVSWRFAVLFSLFSNSALFLFGLLWMRIRDGYLHDAGFLLEISLFMTLFITLATKWGSRWR